MKLSRPLDMKHLVDQLGGFGRFQMWVFILGCYACMIPGCMVVNNTFLSYEPAYRCLLPDCESAHNTTYNRGFLNFTTPFDPSSGAWDACHTFQHSPVLRDSNRTCGPFCDKEDFNVMKRDNCSKYVYDTSLFTSTTVTEFDLVCGDSWLHPLSSSAFMVGMLFGAILLGDIADRIGRRKGLFLSSFVFFVGGMVTAIAPNFYSFVAARVVLGAGGVAVFQVAFIYALEYVPPSWRTFVGVLIEIPFALGEASAALFAYFVRDWRMLQVVSTLPSGIVLTYWWLVPESLRWVLSQGDGRAATEIIRRIENNNNVVVSKDIYDALESNEEDEIPSITVGDSSPPPESVGEEVMAERSRNILDLLRYKNTRNRTLNLMFTWAVVTLCYYGSSSISTRLGGDLFLNFAAIMLIEIPSYIFVYLILDRLGRKGTLCFVMLLGGISSIMCGLTPEDMHWLVVTFSMIGKFGFAGGFGVVFVYTAEIYPTSYRSLGVGMCSMSARVGGILYPFIANLDKIHKPLPLLIFGALALTSGFLTLFLPETLNVELPQTLEKSENLGKGQSIFFFSFSSPKKQYKVENER